MREAVESRYFIRPRVDHSLSLFLQRTISAQIHAWSAVLSFVGILVLARLTAQAPLSQFFTTMLFSICCLTLFLSSALVHFLDDGFHLSPALQKALENIDKCSIYFVIASTYTAVMHVVLSPSTQAWILSLVWFLAIAGCLYTVFIKHLPKWMQSRIVYTGQFVLLGWTALLCMNEIIAALSREQLALIFAGGATYSIGAVGYAFKWPRLSVYVGYHELWHLSVTLGTLMFYLLIASFYA